MRQTRKLLLGKINDYLRNLGDIPPTNEQKFARFMEATLLYFRNEIAARMELVEETEVIAICHVFLGIEPEADFHQEVLSLMYKKLQSCKEKRIVKQKKEIANGRISPFVFFKVYQLRPLVGLSLTTTFCRYLESQEAFICERLTDQSLVCRRRSIRQITGLCLKQ